MGLLDKFIKRTEEYYIVNACYNGDLKYIREYISSGKNLNISDKRNSPLLVAIQQNQIDVVKLLLENGADVNFSPDKTFPTLHMAVDSSNYQTFSCKEKYKNPPTEIIELLIENGANINKKNKFGLTSLEMAKNLITKSGESPASIIDLLEKYAVE